MKERGRSHSFLLREGSWEAKGEYRDRNDIMLPFDGRTEILHTADLWLNRGNLRVGGDPVHQFGITREVVPLADGAEHTTWVSHNPHLGILRGNLAVTPDYILSLFTSADGHYCGTEYLFRIDDGVYRCRGILFAAKERFSSWSAELRRGTL
jgi:hypothetical protein